MRGDLEFRPQRFGQRRVWAVKDPVALKYFHLGEEEYTVLQLLDGQTSLEELKRRCDAAFAPQRRTVEQIQGFLATLHRFGLVQADAPGQGAQLLERHGDKRRRERFESLIGVLAIRFPGVNPRGLLDVLRPLFGWIFSPIAVALSCLLGVAALTLVAVNFAEVEARLPEFEAIVGASNLPWLAVSLAGIKILHELGHGLACRRFGGDCHEMGVMLLVFTPCLYCNVSDSWMMPSKRQRMAIAAAGMYVELILASICTFLWWFSQPGLFHSLCLNTVLICSLGTVLLNGNPLLRYDGYFILSDLVEVPNLRAQASAALRRVLAHYCLGLQLPTERLSVTRGQGWLVLYAVAAGIYRVVVVVLVLWVLDAILRPLHLEVLVLPVAVVASGGLIWPMIDTALRWTRNPARRSVAPARVALVGLLLLGMIAGLVFIPLPMRVAAPLVLEYRDAERVYVTVAGTLESFTAAGQQVRAGQTLAQLKNPTVELDVVKLTADRDRQRLLLKNLEARRLQGSDEGTELPATRATLVDIERRLEQVTRDAERLTLVSPIAGTVLPPPNLPPEKFDPRALPHWTGAPLEERNLGTTLESGTLVCLVGNPREFEAILHLDEHDVELVQNGQQVHIALDHLPGETLSGSVVEIAKLDLDVMPRELAALGELPARTDERGYARPLSTWYQARVKLDGEPQNLVGRMPGRAKIDVAPRTLTERAVRYLKQTFAR
jgi:putative peptide zinc metalloprotease protein